MSEPVWTQVTVLLPAADHPAWSTEFGDDVPRVVRALELLADALINGQQDFTLDLTNEPTALIQWAGSYVQVEGEGNYGLQDDECREALAMLRDLGVSYDAHDEDKYDMPGGEEFFRPETGVQHRTGISSTGESYVTLGELNHAAGEWATVDDAKAWVRSLNGPTAIIDLGPQHAKWVVDAMREHWQRTPHRFNPGRYESPTCLDCQQPRETAMHTNYAKETSK